MNVYYLGPKHQAQRAAEDPPPVGRNDEFLKRIGVACALFTFVGMTLATLPHLRRRLSPAPEAHASPSSPSRKETRADASVARSRAGFVRCNWTVDEPAGPVGQRQDLLVPSTADRSSYWDYPGDRIAAGLQGIAVSCGPRQETDIESDNELHAFYSEKLLGIER